MNKNIKINTELQYTKIQDFKPNNIVNSIFIVLEKNQPVKTKEHMIHHFLISDETGCIQLSLWDEFGEGVQLGDILFIKNGRCTLWTNNLELQKGRKGVIQKIGEFTMQFNETKNISNFEWIEDPPNSKKYIIKGLKKKK